MDNTKNEPVQIDQNDLVQMDRLTFFRSYWESVKLFTDEKRLKLYDEIFSYAFENKPIELENELMSVFIIIKALIDKEMSKNGPNGPTMNKNKNKKKKSNMNIFVQFWSKYPRKEKKATCEEWFNKHDFADEEFQNILSSLEKFKKTKQWQKKEFIPLATTWLNQRRWEDELSCEDLIEDEKDQIAKLEAEVERRKASGEWK